MPLNKSVGNMYPWVSHCWNPLGGACSHDCDYCYMKGLMSKPPVRAKYSGPPRLMEREMSTKLREGLYIFVENCSDLFAEDVPTELIQRVLDHCNSYPDNRYLFQSKNPGRFKEFVFPSHSLLGTTLETNRVWESLQVSRAPSVKDRALDMMELSKTYEVMVSIEPILDFDSKPFSQMILDIKPSFVSIGADSKRMGLPEPNLLKIESLVNGLKECGIPLKLKSNLDRLRGK